MGVLQEVSFTQLIAFVGLAYILLFGLLSKFRGEALSLQFALEGLGITAVGVVLAYWGQFSTPVYPVLFFFLLYTITMRARWMVDLANYLMARRRYRDGMTLFDLALRLRPDVISRRLVEINQAVGFFRLGHVARAREILIRVLDRAETDGLSARHVAAVHYNLGIIARAEGKEDEARRHFNQAVDIAPHSIYAYGAMQALNKPPTSREQTLTDRESS